MVGTALSCIYFQEKKNQKQLNDKHEIDKNLILLRLKGVCVCIYLDVFTCGAGSDCVRSNLR